MNIALTFKNFEPSDHLRAYATRRFDKLRRFLPKSGNVEMTAVLTVDKFRHKADVQFSGDYISISAQEQSSDMYATVDMVLDKLETQLKRHAERLKAKKRRSGGSERDFPPDNPSPAEEDIPRKPGLITAELVEPKPLFMPEAILQFEQRQDDVVFVFLNADDSRINILYRRKNGDIGLITPG
ncbi:MAG: ribosome-associated translation inhibitor RaiA [Desulfovibrio sp.]|jgi:putative sigma-54 modulation protein|nr:ribosome-associated translation inhibitor RaiA [Desulfovibrio sp.]